MLVRHCSDEKDEDSCLYHRVKSFDGPTILTYCGKTIPYSQSLWSNRPASRCQECTRYYKINLGKVPEEGQ